jgi:hypothetical protein
MKHIVLSAIAVAALVAGVASAHGGEYLQNNVGHPVSGVPSAVSITECAPDGLGGPGTPNLGAIRFCAGHLVPNVAGQATLSISDDLISPTSGVYCQDLNANALCGERDPVTNIATEPRKLVCNSVVLSTPIDLTPRISWDTKNWSPANDVLLFVHGQGNGNVVANTPCVGSVVSGGTHGFINHA